MSKNKIKWSSHKNNLGKFHFQTLSNRITMEHLPDSRLESQDGAP